MLKTASLLATALLVTACAQQGVKPDSAALAKAEAQPECVQTGSRIVRKGNDCGASFVRSYSREDLDRTGRTQNVGAALKALDPALQ